MLFKGQRSILGKTGFVSTAKGRKMGRASTVNTIFSPQQNKDRGFATSHAINPSQFAGKLQKKKKICLRPQPIELHDLKNSANLHTENK